MSQPNFEEFKSKLDILHQDCVDLSSLLTNVRTWLIALTILLGLGETGQLAIQTTKAFTESPAVAEQEKPYPQREVRTDVPSYP